MKRSGFARGRGPQEDGSGFRPATEMPSWSADAPRETPARVSVCTGRACRLRWDSESLVDDIQRAGNAAGVPLEVGSCGCLNLCDEGPVVVASPAPGFASSSGQPAERVFVDVGRRDIRDIIGALAVGREQ